MASEWCARADHWPPGDRPKYAPGMPTRSLPGREGILDAAARRFLEEGYAETSVRDIAADVGVKAASIYYHFESKDELLATILDEGIDRITATVTEALAAAEGADPGTRLEVAIGAHLTALFEHGPYTAAHVGVYPSAPAAVRSVGVAARDAYESIWTRLISEAAADGTLHGGDDLRVVRLALLGAMNTALQWFDPGGPRSLQDVASTIAACFVGGR